MTDKELLQQALGCLESYEEQFGANALDLETINAIRARLTEPEEAVEPVAWIDHAGIPILQKFGGIRETFLSLDETLGFKIPLYTHPPRPAVRLSDSDILPLIDMEIEDYLDGGYAKSSYLKSNLQDFARAIESAVLKKNGLEVE